MARRLRTITVVSWLGGAASILPFVAGWFGLSTRASNLLLFAGIVSAFGLSLAVGTSQRLQHAIVRLAGPPDRPTRTLVLVAIVAGAGVAAMLVAAALVGSL